MKPADIRPYTRADREAVLDLTLAVWAPVFAKTRDAVPRFVYDAFYPDGWEARQRADVGALLDAASDRVWTAWVGDQLTGFVGVAFHPEDRMGEIPIVAVDPARQGQGIGRQLLAHGEAVIRASGAEMVMVETVGDPGHARARRVYAAAGYQSWPVARYFKPLSR